MIHNKLIFSALLLLNTVRSVTKPEDPWIVKLQNNSDKYLEVIKGGSRSVGGTAQALSPPRGTVISPSAAYDYCLFSYLVVNIRSESGDGPYLGTASISVRTAPNGVDKYLYDDNGLLTFTYNDAESEYPGANPWNYRRVMDITYKAAPAPVISNDGWGSGMRNSEATAVAGNDYWLQDYGMDEPGRWTVKHGAICQTTRALPGGSPNQGSRAYPAALEKSNDVWSYSQSSNGAGFTGAWQIAMKCGSNGAGNFCETFYLSERLNMTPGPSNYGDGSGSAKFLSREIDIMETRWKPDGPQANLPTGGGSQYGDFVGMQMGKWDDIGGLPMKGDDYATFGCLVREDNMWFYGYKPNGELWYVSDAIPKDSTWKQEGPLVPYIGTWGSGPDGVFDTCYKDFVYVKTDNAAILNKNPKENPEAFGPALALKLR